MGWELRHGTRLYLYRSRRENGRPVKTYLAASADPFGFGDLMAHTLGRLRRREARFRQLRRRVRTEYRARIDDLLRAVGSANADLRVLAEGALHALGYHRHHRGEWRMKRELALLRGAITALEKRSAELKPLLHYTAPAGDAEAVELFAQARAGDANALARVHALIRERNWQDWIGNIGRQATVKLIEKAAGGDPVWEAGLIQKVNALQSDLLGDRPTVLEKVLVRRVVNGWIAVHALELELTLRPPAEARDRAHLDRALSRAQGRMTGAARELARVRRLAVPVLMVNYADKQVNVVATPAVAAGA